MTIEKAKETFLSAVRRISALDAAGNLLAWDQRTIAPPKGLNGRAQVLGAVSAEAFRIKTSPEYREALDRLKGEALDPVFERMAFVARRAFDRDAKIPADVYEKFVVDAQISEAAWGDAKRSDDYGMYAPHLQRMIDYARRFADLWGYAAHPYDAMLDGYESGLTVKDVDGVFGRLRADMVALLREVPRIPALRPAAVPVEKQREIGLYLLAKTGYDLDAGNLYATEHPFSVGIHAGDVRVTTHYRESDPVSSIFSVLHEGGHGMYDQNLGPELRDTNLDDGASMGIHESQSRFWENIIGRSYAFWDTHFATVNRLAGGGLASDARAWYRGVNRVKPSLIRTEADELTYNLHIIIRYELEKEIAAGNLNAGALRDAWNDRYREYLGVQAEKDGEGILQDIHWSDASFGYFPTYSLGNLYAAQFAHALEKELGSLDALIGSESGLGKIGGWLKENIQRYGALEEPGDILVRVTGEGLNASYLTTYLRGKLLAL